MLVQSSDILLSSAHQLTMRHSVHERLRVRALPNPVDHPAAPTTTPLAEGPEGGEPGQRTGHEGSSKDLESINRPAQLQGSSQLLEVLKQLGIALQQLDELITRLTGGTGTSPAPSSRPATPSDPNAPSTAPATSPAPTTSVAIRYDRWERYRETETTAFQASGTVHLADGRVIQLSQNDLLQREYQSRSEFSIRAVAELASGGAPAPATSAPATQPTAAIPSTPATPAAPAGAADPPAPAPATTSALTLGNGVLGIDKNGDGDVTDPGESIGSSGDGFAALKAFDLNGNGWIDSGDAVFGQLGLASKDPSGASVTHTLADSGVGAIYLGSVATPFGFKDANNQLQAELVSSGIYLNEDGTSGTVRQLDLVG